MYNTSKNGTVLLSPIEQATAFAWKVFSRFLYSSRRYMWRNRPEKICGANFIGQTHFPTTTVSISKSFIFKITPQLHFILEILQRLCFLLCNSFQSEELVGRMLFLTKIGENVQHCQESLMQLVRSIVIINNKFL